MKQLRNGLYDVGVEDASCTLFEGQFKTQGMAYHSYLIVDDKVALLDTVEKSYTTAWLNHIKEVLKDRPIDYLVITHMEPDHSGNILSLLEAYPDVTIVGNKITFKLLDQFYRCKSKRLEVKSSYTLSLGKHTLRFYEASMIHWPEVMMVYETTNHILFSADGFGRFGGTHAIDEARRYYFGILGKYGYQVQRLLEVLEKLDIELICPLHGQVLENETISTYFNLYRIWSRYEPEVNGVVIIYASIYGHTKKVAELMSYYLKRRGYRNVELVDLVHTDMTTAISKAFMYSHMLLASVTYNGDLFPLTKSFIDGLVIRQYQKRIVGLVENGSWYPVANRLMHALLKDQRKLLFLDHQITIPSSINLSTIVSMVRLADEMEMIQHEQWT